MAIIETEIWKENPEKPGTLIFDSHRKARDIFVELKEHLKAEGRLPDEYFTFDNWNWGKGALFPKDAYIFCDVNYGGSEGIYLDVFLRYEKEVYEYNDETKIVDWHKRMVTEQFAAGKTLGDSIEDLDKMNLVASSVISGFYGHKTESLERYARIASGEEQRVYPPRRDNDNIWEQMPPNKLISAEDILKILKDSFGMPDNLAADGDFELSDGIEKDKLYPENAEIEIFESYPKDKDRGLSIAFHIHYLDDYGMEHREWFGSGITDREDIINMTLDKNFLKDYKEPVGYLYFASSDEKIPYYSETEIINAYEKELFSLGIFGVEFQDVRDKNLWQKLYNVYKNEMGGMSEIIEINNENITPGSKMEMSELKIKLYGYELAKIGFPEAKYIPELNFMITDPENGSSPKINNKGKVLFDEEYRDLVLDKIMPIVHEIEEVTKAWNNSSVMPFENLSQYRILAEFNNIILTASDNTANGRGFDFMTWKYDRDRNGVNTGYYTDDYSMAKGNFAVRAGLVNGEKDILSKKYERMYSKTFMLPEKAENNDRVERYFTRIHNIDPAIIKGLIKWGKLYESDENHNAVFVAYDNEKNAKSANEYNTYTKGAVHNPEILSDTTYNFILLGKQNAIKLYVFENPLESLIQATSEKNNGLDWTDAHRMALTASYMDASYDGLKRYLQENPQIKQVTFWSPADDRILTSFMSTFEKNIKDINKYDIMNNVSVDLKDMKDIDLESESKEKQNNINTYAKQSSDEIYDNEVEENEDEEF